MTVSNVAVTAANVMPEQSNRPMRLLIFEGKDMSHARFAPVVAVGGGEHLDGFAELREFNVNWKLSLIFVLTLLNLM